ncbi:N-acetyltransferase family protein [Nocardia tengchongensis]
MTPEVCVLVEAFMDDPLIPTPGRSPSAGGMNRWVRVLRSAVPEDAMAVARVHVRAWQAGYRGLLPEEHLDGLRAVERAKRYTFHLTGAGDPATTVALDRAGTVCGFVTTGPCRDDESLAVGEVLALHVDPDRWGQGVGTVLIGAARARLAGAGFAEAVLWVLAGNDRAERFYRRDGWEYDGATRSEVVWGVPVDENRYRATLIDRSRKVEDRAEF